MYIIWQKKLSWTPSSIWLEQTLPEAIAQLYMYFQANPYNNMLITQFYIHSHSARLMQ